MKAIFVEVMFHKEDDLNDLYDQISPSSVNQKEAFDSIKQKSLNPT